MNALESLPWCPPNQTKWTYVQTHGSVSLDHVSEDVRTIVSMLASRRRSPSRYLLTLLMYFYIMNLWCSSAATVKPDVTKR